MDNCNQEIIDTRKGLLGMIAGQLREEFGKSRSWAKIEVFKRDLSHDLWESITDNLSTLQPYSDITRNDGICNNSPARTGVLNFYRDRYWVCGFKVCLAQCGNLIYWSTPEWRAEDAINAADDDLEIDD